MNDVREERGKGWLGRARTGKKGKKKGPRVEFVVRTVMGLRSPVHGLKSRKGLCWVVWARCFPYGDYSGWSQKWDLGLSSIVLADIMKNEEIYILNFSLATNKLENLAYL